MAPSYLIQKDIDLYYSMNKALPGYLTSMQGFEKLKNDFNMACTQCVIVDDSIPAAKLMEMEKKLENMDGVSSLLAYNSIVGPAIPDDILPDEIMQLCKQDGLQLFLVNSKFDPATPELTAQLQQMEQIVKSYDPNAYITGEGAIEQGLIDTTDRDFAVTAALSVAAIFILIAIVFKSVTLPIILVLSIELAIWLNLSLSVIMGKEASFVDPTVINCIQLGATVDYAILLTTRFREELRFVCRADEDTLPRVFCHTLVEWLAVLIVNACQIRFNCFLLLCFNHRKHFTYFANPRTLKGFYAPLTVKLGNLSKILIV